MSTEPKGRFFSKFLSALSGKPSVSEQENPELSPYAPKQNEPDDLKFVKKFTEAGGNFLYCESSEDAVFNLQKILLETGVRNLFVPEDSLRSLLSNQNIKSSSGCDSSDGIFTSCEALVSFNGGVMIDGFQTGGNTLSSLPETHIIYGKTSLIVQNLSAGMSKINNRYKDQRPSQITTLKGPRDKGVLQASADPNKKRNLYLLLIEDVLKL